MSHAHSHGGVTGVRAANTLEILSWLTREHLCMSRVDLANIHSLCAYAQEGNTSLILAIIKDNDATAEALIAATASAGALDVQVGRRGQEEDKSECMWVVRRRWVGQQGGCKGAAPSAPHNPHDEGWSGEA